MGIKRQMASTFIAFHHDVSKGIHLYHLLALVSFYYSRHDALAQFIVIFTVISDPFNSTSQYAK